MPKVVVAKVPNIAKLQEMGKAIGEDMEKFQEAMSNMDLGTIVSDYDNISPLIAIRGNFSLWLVIRKFVIISGIQMRDSYVWIDDGY